MCRIIDYLLLNNIFFQQQMLKDDANQGLIDHKSQNLSKQNIKSSQVKDIQHPNRSKRKKSQLTYILKILNFIVGIAYVAFACYCYGYGYQQTDLQSKGPFIRYVLPAYVGLSGLVILFIECGIGIFVRNLRFFYNYFGRGFFNVYAGLMPLMLINDWQKVSTFEIITIVAASVMCVVGLLYMGLKCFCCQKQGLNKQVEDS